jgi:hypothetical protein
VREWEVWGWVRGFGCLLRTRLGSERIEPLATFGQVLHIGLHLLRSLIDLFLDAIRLARTALLATASRTTTFSAATRRARATGDIRVIGLVVTVNDTLLKTGARPNYEGGGPRQGETYSYGAL